MSDATQNAAQATAGDRRWGAFVVVDVVESVRLQRMHADDPIGRWRRFVNEVRHQVLPAHGGRLLRSLGDGLLLEFADVPAAAAAAMDLRDRLGPHNGGHAAPARIQLRTGIDVGFVVADDLDVYGPAVNIAARLSQLAGPDEIVVSADVRDALVHGLDADWDDLGECYLKHVDEPLRAFRLRRATSPRLGADRHDTRPGPTAPDRPVSPTLGLMPLVPHSVDPVLAGALTDDLCVALSRSPQWRSISRLSVAALGRRKLPGQVAVAHLGVDYLLLGTIESDGHGLLRIVLHLTEARTQGCIGRIEQVVAPAAAFDSGHGLAAALVREVSGALARRHAEIVHTVALPNLPGYALLLHAMTLLHRLGHADNQRAREALEHLVERHPRAADARAWLAKWHFLQLAQGRSADRKRDAGQARHQLARALHDQPDHALSLALEGHLRAFVDGNLDGARQALLQATRLNPSESLAWLFLCNVWVALGRGAEAVAAITQAQRLSPLDPLGYFYDHFATLAHGCAGDSALALSYARRSVAQNALHLSSLAQLIVCLVEVDQPDEARDVAQRYLALRPDASVQRFIDGHIGGHTPYVQRQAEALLLAGLPR